MRSQAAAAHPLPGAIPPPWGWSVWDASPPPATLPAHRVPQSDSDIQWQCVPVHSTPSHHTPLSPGSNTATKRHPRPPTISPKHPKTNSPVASAPRRALALTQSLGAWVGCAAQTAGLDVHSGKLRPHRKRGFAEGSRTRCWVGWSLRAQV